MSASADCNLLFGILAVQLDFISNDALTAAMNAWLLDKTKPLGAVLRDRGQLSDEELQRLSALVEVHLKQHGNDPERSLAALLAGPKTLPDNLVALPAEVGQRCLRIVEMADTEMPAPETDQCTTLSPQPPDSRAHDVTLPPVRPSTLSPLTAPHFEKELAAGLPNVAGFEILEKLGEGGMGVVFQARQIALNRIVALKMILSGGLAGAQEKARFLAEAEAVAALHHPGVVQVYEFGTADGRPYFALEYCSGGNLAAKLAGTPLPPAEAATLVASLAGAVHAAHEKGIIHRDLKPGNVLLAADGTPKVTDFGLAKRIDGGEHLTQSGAIVGTPSYMAPEQANDAKSVGPLADIYALGAILYECLSGRPPFKAAKPLDTVLQVVSDEPAPVRRLNPLIPADLETICHKCLQKDPNRRYASAADLAADLGRWQRGESITARPVGRAERAWRWCRRNRALAGSLAAVVAVVVLGLAGLTAGLVVVTGLNGRLDTANAELVTRNAELDTARKTAEGQRDRALAARRRTREALDAMVSGVTEQSLATQKALSPEQTKFLESVLSYYEEFAAEPGEDQEGRERLATAHWRLADIRHRLGQREIGAALFVRTAEIYEKLVADYPAVPQYRRDLAQIKQNQGLTLADLGKWAEAEAADRSALAIRERLVANYPTEPGYRAETASSRQTLGALLEGLARRKEAETEFRAALAIRDQLAVDFPTKPENRRGLAYSHNSLGLLLEHVGRESEAEAEFRAALAIKEQLATDFPDEPDFRHDLARSHNGLAILLAGMRRRSEAEVEYRAALAIREKLAADFPGVLGYRVELGGTNVNIGNLMCDRGDAAAAVDWHGKGIDQLKMVLVAEPGLVHAREFLRNAYFGRARDFTLLKRFSEALPDWDGAIRFDNSPGHSYLQVRRATCLARLGRVDDAAREAVELAADPAATAGICYDCACVVSLSAAVDHNPEADRHAAQAVELVRQAIAKGYSDIPNLVADPDLAALRRRADFAALLWDLAELPPAPTKP